MPAVAENGETGPGGKGFWVAEGEATAPPLHRPESERGRGETPRELTLRLLLGAGSLVLLGIFVLAMLPAESVDLVDRYPNPRIEPELLGKRFARLWLKWITGEFVFGFWLALITALAWLAFYQVRRTGVAVPPQEGTWLDLRQPLEPGMERIPLSTPDSDWLWMLRSAAGLMLVGLGGLLYGLENNELMLLVIPWLATLLWLGEGFVRILWRRVAETLVLTRDRIVWHLGPCQVQIPYGRLEEVLRGTRFFAPGQDRRELVLVTRGPLMIVARPGLPLWLLYWLLPPRERVVHSGLTHESCRLKPVNELAALETLAGHLPHLIARGAGLMLGGSIPQHAASVSEVVEAPGRITLETVPSANDEASQHALLPQSGQRVLLVPSLTQGVLVHLGIWLVAPVLTLAILEELWRIPVGNTPWLGWRGIWFGSAFLAWCLLVAIWMALRWYRQGVSRVWEFPATPVAPVCFRQVRGRWAWLDDAGWLYSLVVLLLGIQAIDRLRVVLQVDELAVLEGLGAGVLLTIVAIVLGRIWSSSRDSLCLLPDRLVCDRGWQQVAIPYAELQEATLMRPVDEPGGAGEVRLRSAVPAFLHQPAGTKVWPLVPPTGGREIPAYWHDRAWRITLAEPERFLEELGPHVPHLVRGETGWIGPLPPGGSKSRPASSDITQSTTNSTSRQ